MTDGNTDAINRHLAEREAYDDQQEALQAVEKLAEAEERIEELEAERNALQAKLDMAVKGLERIRNYCKYQPISQGEKNCAAWSEATLAAINERNRP